MNQPEKGDDMNLWKGSLAAVAFLAVCGLAFAEGTPKAETKAMPDPHVGIFAEKCAKCHDLGRVDEAHKTKTTAEMTETLRRMQQKPDSGISQTELNEMLKLY